MPSQKGNDDEYFDTTYAERELKDELSQMAMDHFGQEVVHTNNNQDTNTNEPSMIPEGMDNTPDISGDTPTVTDDDIPF